MNQRRPPQPKRRKRTPRSSESPPASEAGVAPLLPMEIQAGDRFAAEGFEWEVISRPEVLHGAKSLRARVARPGLPETEREITWPAHVRVAIRRAASRG